MMKDPKVLRPKKHVKQSIQSSQSIIDDLERIYQAAFDAGNYTAALKAKELQMKEQRDHPVSTNPLTAEAFGEHIHQLKTMDLKKLLDDMKKTLPAALLEL